MKLVAAILVSLFATAPIVETQSIHARAKKRGVHKGLIDDLSASDIGDILTVVIRETHKIKNEDKVNRSKNSSLAASLEAFNLKSNLFKGGILPKIDVRSKQSQQGNAKQEKDQTFEARIAVTIIDKLPNGNLIISGRRTVIVDDEQKSLRISGIIRAFDVEADNTVPSNKVAEAKVAIEGIGKNTESVTKGPVAQIIETAWWLIWPF